MLEFILNDNDYQNHIRLITDDFISKEWALVFELVVKNLGPQDILKTLYDYDEVGDTIEVCSRFFVDDEGNNVLELPLNRNLEETEAEKIVFIWAKLYPDDFEIDTSTPALDPVETECEVCTDKYEDVLLDIANKLDTFLAAKHNRWIDDQSIDGWSFSFVYNEENKTTPMMRPWHELPEDYKNNVSYAPQNLMKLVNKIKR